MAFLFGCSTTAPGLDNDYVSIAGPAAQGPAPGGQYVVPGSCLGPANTNPSNSLCYNNGEFTASVGPPTNCCYSDNGDNLDYSNGPCYGYCPGSADSLYTGGNRVECTFKRYTADPTTCAVVATGNPSLMQGTQGIPPFTFYGYIPYGQKEPNTFPPPNNLWSTCDPKDLPNGSNYRTLMQNYCAGTPFGPSVQQPVPTEKPLPFCPPPPPPGVSFPPEYYPPGCGPSPSPTPSSLPPTNPGNIPNFFTNPACQTWCNDDPTGCSAIISQVCAGDNLGLPACTTQCSNPTIAPNCTTNIVGNSSTTGYCTGSNLENEACKTYCFSSATTFDCDSNLTAYCAQSGNETVDVCQCFLPTSFYQSYYSNLFSPSQATSATTASALSEVSTLPWCSYLNCVNSGYLPRSTQPCPPQAICVQNIVTQNTGTETYNCASLPPGTDCSSYQQQCNIELGITSTTSISPSLPPSPISPSSAPPVLPSTSPLPLITTPSSSSLSTTDKIIIGVVVGVGVPLLAVAITLGIIYGLRKREEEEY